MATAPLPSLLVVIVNYRTALLVTDCLLSLAPDAAANPALRVTVVDNASVDGSAGVIASAIRDGGWQGWARLIEAPRNGGFAYGNNLAVRAALATAAPPDFIWLLNPDTRAHPGAAGTLVDFLRANPAAGIAGSGIETDDGASWPYAFRFPSILSELERGLRIGPVTRLLARFAVPRPMPQVATTTDWVSGASMMVRRAVFDSVGLMDEAYFLYFEETDFCRAARRAGWSCWYVPAATVVHIAGQSTGVTSVDAGRRRIPAYWFDSRRRYFLKNHGRVYAITADLVWMLSHILCVARRRIDRQPNIEPQNLLRDFLVRSALFNGKREPWRAPANARAASSKSVGWT